jgi:hypothetical protein
MQVRPARCYRVSGLFPCAGKNPVQEQADDEQAKIPGRAIFLFFFPVMVIWT